MSMHLQNQILVLLLIIFFVLAVVLFVLTNTLFERLSSKYPEYYMSIGRPSILGFEGLRRGLAADKLFIILAFKSVPISMPHNREIIKLARRIRKLYLIYILI